MNMNGTQATIESLKSTRKAIFREFILFLCSMVIMGTVIVFTAYLAKKASGRWPYKDSIIAPVAIFAFAGGLYLGRMWDKLELREKINKLQKKSLHKSEKRQ